MIRVFDILFEKFSVFSFVCALCLALASCESRKDVFYPLDEGPAVLFSKDAVDFSSNLSLSIRNGEDVTFHYRLNGEYPYSLSTDLVLVEFLWFVGDSTFKDSKLEDIKFLVNEKDSTITIRSLRTKYCFTKMETYKKVTFSLSSQDVYQKPSSATASVSVSSFRGLVSRVDSLSFDEAEPRVSFTASYDSNAFSDRAVLYEYLFDGEIMYDADGWESPDFSSWNANPGQAARGGYYLTATPYTSIKHVFQTQGVHSLAVRCKSSTGMWGPWTRYTVDLDSREWGGVE